MREATSELTEAWMRLAGRIHRLGDAKSSEDLQSLAEALAAMETFNAAHPEVLDQIRHEQSMIADSDRTAVIACDG